jgi:hypothetical protein
MKARLLAAGTLAALLAGCGSEDRVCDFGDVVQMPAYDQPFRDGLAQDVDRICGNQDKGLRAEYGNACKFIQDSLELRAKIAATRQS